MTACARIVLVYYGVPSEAPVDQPDLRELKSSEFCTTGLFLYMISPSLIQFSSVHALFPKAAQCILVLEQGRVQPQTLTLKLNLKMKCTTSDAFI